MTEFYTVKQIDNSRLVRPVAPDRLRECARLVVLGGLIALWRCCYAWQHFRDDPDALRAGNARSERAQAGSSTRN